MSICSHVRVIHLSGKGQTDNDHQHGCCHKIRFAGATRFVNQLPFKLKAPLMLHFCVGIYLEVSDLCILKTPLYMTKSACSSEVRLQYG